MTPHRSLAIRPRELGLAALALGLGIAVAALDSRPGWDDAGITAGLLVASAALLAAIDGRRPWRWTLLVGSPLPILELPTSASAGPLVALVFAAVGASLGLLVRRLLVAGPRATEEAQGG